MRWLLLTVGLLTLLLRQAGAQTYDGDAERGKTLAEKQCARCHVVGDFNKYGGLGSTPSFQRLVRLPDWRERFESFFARRPHPVFVRVPGQESTSLSPSHVAPFDLTRDDLADLLTFMEAFKSEERKKTGD